VDLHAAETIADAIFRETLSRQEGHEQVARARFLELVVFLSRRYRQTVATEVDGLLRLAKAAAYIEEHYREPVRVESLAGLAGMSASHFMRVFHRHYQTSPGAYVQMLRLQHAAFDLASSSRSVTAVALANGFTDSNYFARQFRRYMRMSPREYRARERGRAGAEGTVVM